MTKPLGYYVDPDAAITALTEKYGEQLQHMPNAHKLLTLAILTNTLLGTYSNPNYKIEDEIWNRLRHCEEISEELQKSLLALNDCTSKTLLSLIEAIVAQIRQLYLNDLRANALTVMRAIRQHPPIQ